MTRTPEIQAKLARLAEMLAAARVRSGSRYEHWEEMVDLAHELHQVLRPVHHRYMIENRGVDPGDREFYNHIHPIQDLLSFADNPHVNDDPVDQTIGAEFIFPVFTRRWGHNDQYEIKRTEGGWHINHATIGGDCTPDGRPFLYRNFEQDSVNYPEDLPRYFEWLWKQAGEQGLSAEQVQAALTELADWVSVCERSSPRHEILRMWK